MLYKRVKSEHDNTNLYNRNGRFIGMLIGGELLTPVEYRKIAEFVKEDWFEEVIIPKTLTYKFFGARFETKGGAVVR